MQHAANLHYITITYLLEITAVAPNMLCSLSCHYILLRLFHRVRLLIAQMR